MRRPSTGVVCADARSLTSKRGEGGAATALVQASEAQDDEADRPACAFHLHLLVDGSAQESTLGAGAVLVV